MKENPLRALKRLGQSVWIDDIRRDLITSGTLQRLIDEDGLCGMTSNPAIFEKAIGEHDDYDADIRILALQKADANSMYESLSQRDIQGAADLFRPLYDKTLGIDGYVSLEVNPHLAHDTQGTIEEARRLWKAVDRPNIFIKVPATREGLPAIQQLISEAINVNVTLVFGLPRYQEVANAYITGLEKRLANGESIRNIASVASFFLSRIDTQVDSILSLIAQGADEKVQLARQLQGQTAISSAKTAYQTYKEIFSGERFKRLAASGARPQWLLWASTSTKNPEYSDVKYVEPLIGPETINTMPLSTFDAYRNHGEPAAASLEEDVGRAGWVLEELPKLGINIDSVTQQLEDEGIEKFCKPFDKLLETLDAKISRLSA